MEILQGETGAQILDRLRVLLEHRPNSPETNAVWGVVERPSVRRRRPGFHSAVLDETVVRRGSASAPAPLIGLRPGEGVVDLLLVQTDAAEQRLCEFRPPRKEQPNDVHRDFARSQPGRARVPQRLECHPRRVLRVEDGVRQPAKFRAAAA